MTSPVPATSLATALLLMVAGASVRAGAPPERPPRPDSPTPRAGVKDPARVTADPRFPAPEGRALFARLDRLVRQHQEKIQPETKLLFVISIDGLRPDAWERARTPHLDYLAARGAWSKRARSADLSRTVPSHVSMVTGLQPRRHRKDHKIWLPGRGEVRRPTMFRWVRAVGETSTVVVGKRKLKVLDVPEVGVFRIGLNHPLQMTGHARRILSRALHYLQRGRLGLYFLHFPDVDSRGHRYGWMSRRQLRALENVDRHIGKLLTWVDGKDLEWSTSWIVTADHGGHGKGHSRGLEVDRLVPLILHGAQVVPGVRLADGYSVVDVAPTASALLGGGAPLGLDGAVVQEALTFEAPAPSAEVGRIRGRRENFFRKLGRFLERINPFSL